ncbi:MAG: hypothetical protein JXC33_12555 [Deltaproteobacteria bacterium]|nr:hypothetical protein [Deltaproteobacteria bacterium]
MNRRITFISTFAGCLVILQMVIGIGGIVHDACAMLRVISDQTVRGFAHPESVAFDPSERVLFVSQFGSVLQPKLKDEKGKISKVSLDGGMIEDQYLPEKGVVLNKPKGIWIENGVLWVTDIDMVWVFDLNTRKGRPAALPGAEFANDATVIDNILFVSDSGRKRIYRVKPANFLEPDIIPDVAIYGTELSFAPNGLYPSKSKALLVAGYDNGDQDYGVYSIAAEEKFETLIKNIGKLDGLVQLEDGSILVTDWKSKSLIRWNRKTGMKQLATEFGGPADFCVIPEGKGLLVVVPDLVKSELRFIRLSR